MCGLARSLLEKKRYFVTSKAEVSNGQKIDCWRGLYSSHAERYANVAGIVDTPLHAVQTNVPIILIKTYRWPRVRCQRVGSVYKYDG